MIRLSGTYRKTSEADSRAGVAKNRRFPHSRRDYAGYVPASKQAIDTTLRKPQHFVGWLYVILHTEPLHLMGA